MHIPVLPEESVKLWASLDKNTAVKEGIYVDGTFGEGGHTSHLIDLAKKNIIVIGIDRDEMQIKKAKVKFKKLIAEKKLYLFHDSFANILNIISTFQKKQKQILNDSKEEEIKVRGILFDFGIATNHLHTGRGFSFKEEKDPLDMRFNPKENTLTAADILNDWHPEELERIFREYGEERYSRKVANNIRKAREEGKVFKNVADLLFVLRKTLAPSYRKQRIHYATRIFQALRIATNDEYENIKQGLAGSLEILGKNGRMVAISFHSGEDRIVKNFFREESKDCLCKPNIPICVCNHRKSLQIITRKPVVPSLEEINLNPNARSAKLRAAEKIK